MRYHYCCHCGTLHFGPITDDEIGPECNPVPVHLCPVHAHWVDSDGRPTPEWKKWQARSGSDPA